MEELIFRKGKDEIIPNKERRTFSKRETIGFLSSFLDKRKKNTDVWLVVQDQQFISVLNLNDGERKPSIYYQVLW